MARGAAMALAEAVHYARQHIQLARDHGPANAAPRPVQPRRSAAEDC
ncbi:MAG: hypothetical protein ACKV2O_00505 [Acidimicrobiales bacterium]